MHFQCITSDYRQSTKNAPIKGRKGDYWQNLLLTGDYRPDEQYHKRQRDYRNGGEYRTQVSDAPKGVGVVLIVSGI